MGLPKREQVTYADYQSWDDDVRCEVVDGKIISMNFSPSKKHQVVLGQLHRLFGNYFEGKSCEVIIAPFDVYLFADQEGVTPETNNWVEPDLFVVCDETKFGDSGYYGAPDLVIEVLSPSNPENDKIYKLNKYEQAGVKEYWIVDPNYRIVEVYLQTDQRLALDRAYAGNETIPVNLFKDLSIDLNRVFIE